MAIEIGIYEKAIRRRDSWGEFFSAARDAGFAFVDLSVDESEEKASRLIWPYAERRRVRDAAAGEGLALGGICLSIHRKIAPASQDEAVRKKACVIVRQGIELCRDLGIPILQLAGYYDYYGKQHPDSRKLFIDFLHCASNYAALNGVMLGVENVDTNGITSITSGRDAVEQVNSPWLKLYPDIGNLTERGLDTQRELATGQGLMLALHAKDTRPGEPRRVPMGQGDVPWKEAFDELHRQKWSGRIMIEMWNDDSLDSELIASNAREFIAERLIESNIAISGKC